ncbi:MAG: hypothetical protein WAK55_17225 [Xanthobacteraceae bacterium]
MTESDKDLARATNRPVPSPALPTQPQTKMRKLPPKIRAAIEALVSGQVRTITAAAKKVGLSRERLSRALGEPHNAEALRTRAAREVAMSAGRASARLTKLLDSTSERVALEATKFSLGVAGIKPANDAVNVNVGVSVASWCIDLRGRNYDGPATMTVTGAGAVILPKPKPLDGGPVIDAPPAGE